MKKITALDDRMLSINDDEHQEHALPTRREVLRLIGNVKADTADDSRRVIRIINKLRDKNAVELVLENDDMSHIQKVFEKNAMGLTAWIQGQILDLLDSAEKA